MRRLGINATPVTGHHNHFHIYFKPPKIQKIIEKNKLFGDLDDDERFINQEFDGGEKNDRFYYAEFF